MRQGVRQHLAGLVTNEHANVYRGDFEILKATGGVDKLNMAFYQEGDLQNDKEWDIWRVEGPAFVWHFRGHPHVHAYINIGMKS